MRLHILFYSCILSFFLPIQLAKANKDDYITIAILAKDKAHTLPLYLTCIENQTWPTKKTYLYIRTNNNNDTTAHVLRNWIERVKDKYAKIYFDDSDVDTPIQEFGQHEWNYTRFKILGDIRQASVDWAYKHHSHYFVADCDNFIFPNTIASMLQLNLPVAAPFLKCYSQKYYSNYHETIDSNGYYAPSVMYYEILDQNITGILRVPVVHCTYFIQHEALPYVCYDDESARYEYVIFSDSMRRYGIDQYIDNRTIYGYVSFAENTQELHQEPFLCNFPLYQHPSNE